LTTVYERTNREICLPSRNQNMAKELVLTGGSKTKQEKNKSEPVLTDEHETRKNGRLACCRNRDGHAPRVKMHGRITPEPKAKTDRQSMRERMKP
jgi:hypothetical protein